MAKNKKQNDPNVQEQSDNVKKGKWTTDRSSLVSVEKTRQSVKRIDEKGNLVGGTEYFGKPI